VAISTNSLLSYVISFLHAYDHHSKPTLQYSAGTVLRLTAATVMAGPVSQPASILSCSPEAQAD